MIYEFGMLLTVNSLPKKYQKECSLSNYMPHLSKNIETDFPGQIFPELFRFKTPSLLLGHPVQDILW